MKGFLVIVIIALYAMLAQAQSDTCNNNDALVVNTAGNKNNRCIPLNQQPVGTGATMIIANDTVTGTTVNRLAKLTGAPSSAIITATSDTENAVGVVTAGAGTTGSATITILGQASCAFDGATTAGNYVVISAVTAGMCHDAGSSFPTAQAAYGRVLSTNGGAGTYVMELMTPDIAFQNAGNGKSRPGGANTYVQFHDTGNAFGGVSSFSYDKTAHILGLSQSSSDRLCWTNTPGTVGFGCFQNGAVGTVKFTVDGSNTGGAIYTPETTMTVVGSDPRPFLGLAGQIQTHTLTGNRTLGFVGTDGGSAAKDGTVFTLIFIQDATGSRTLTWNSGYKFTGGTVPTLTTTANAVDIFRFIVSATGTKAYCIGQFLDVK